ncbi:MAG: hypothetical protein WD898_01150, partial [Candidatus Paceibacterota bacterium]
MSGAIYLKHDYELDQMYEMKGKWYGDEVDMAILQAKKGKHNALAGKDSQSPSKSVEVYELRGVFPKTWLNTDENEEYDEDDGYSRQVHIITFYKTSDGKDEGICLYKGKTKQIFKAYKRTNRFGTACGMGGIEELYQPQVWTNFSEIHLANMLASASKMILQTASKNVAVENDLNDLDNNSIITYEDGKPLTQVPLQPINRQAFDNSIIKWEQRANTLGSASDPSLGKNPTSGTPLGTVEIVTQQGEGIHDYRKGKIADFWHEIYTDWVVKYFAADLNKGNRWLDELSMDEIQEVAQRVAETSANAQMIEAVLAGQDVVEEQRLLLIDLIKEDFRKGGKKRFIEAMKDEFKKLPLKLKFSVAGKQKNL